MKTRMIKDLSLTEELNRKAMEDVRGGRINQRDLGPAPHLEPDYAGG
jgi:hypothetical protein